MTALAPLTYGKVTGRFVATIGDGTDTDTFPDVVPLTGTVTFVPSIISALVVTATPDPATILPTPITAKLDSNGYIISPTNQWDHGIWLVATDDPSLNPSNFTYQVSFQLTLAGAPVRYGPFNIEVPGSTIIDLTTAAPVTVSNGIAITRGEKGEKGQGVIVLQANDPVPADTPVGTVIVRTVPN